MLISVSLWDITLGTRVVPERPSGWRDRGVQPHRLNSTRTAVQESGRDGRTRCGACPAGDGSNDKSLGWPHRPWRSVTGVLSGTGWGVMGWPSMWRRPQKACRGLRGTRPRDRGEVRKQLGPGLQTPPPPIPGTLGPRERGLGCSSLER